MPASRFQGVQHVRAGSPVSAANTSQSTRELEARTNYLLDQLQSIAAGALLQWADRAVSADVLPGSAVFWNSATHRFEPAVAAAEHDELSGVYVATLSSDVLGVCVTKRTPTTGTIVFAGYAEFTPTQVANLFGDGATPGRYYLSAIVGGRLVRQRPAVTVAVAYLLGPGSECDVNSWVYILPQHRNFLEDHIHYQLELAAVPAGTHVVPEYGEEHAITAPDSSIRGWLPATHSSFGGTAPTGAVFGYNIAADAAVAAVWPPLPTSSACLEILRPDAEQYTIPGFVRVSQDFVKIDLNGIWWMTDCFDQVPWPTLYTGDDESSSSSSAAGCPVQPPVRLILSFVRMLAITDKTVVTSLQPGEGEPLEFLDVNGQPATTGDLHAKLNLSLLVDADETYGGEVLKGVATNSSRFTRGWVTEGVVSGSEAITLSSSHSRRLDPDGPSSSENPIVHQGVVSIELTADASNKEIQPQLTKLTDTLEREHKGVLYVAFPSGRTSSAKYSFAVPVGGLPGGDLQMHMRAAIFGRSAGPLPAMTMTYQRVARAVDAPVLITDTATSFAFDPTTLSDDVDGSGTDLAADSVLEVDSAAFAVQAGDTIFVTVTRAANATPVLANDVGLLRIIGVISKDE